MVEPSQLAVCILNQCRPLLTNVVSRSALRSLGRVGEFINNVVRANDVVSRYSEHSFVILFPETSPEDAWVAIHKLESAVKDQTIQTPDKTLEIGFEPFVTGRHSDDTATISVEDILQSIGDSTDAVFWANGSDTQRHKMNDNEH